MWDGTGRSPHNLIYTCIVRNVRKSWYITWKSVQRKGGFSGREIKRKFKKYNTRRKNSKYLIILFWLGRGWFLYLIRINTLPTIHNHYVFSKFRLVLSPTLYKFIVWACWAWVQSCFAWVQSCFGVQAKTGPYIYIYEMGSSCIWCNSYKITHFLHSKFLKDLTVKNKQLNIYYFSYNLPENY